jgi:hypothetical protein
MTPARINAQILEQCPQRGQMRRASSLRNARAASATISTGGPAFRFEIETSCRGASQRSQCQDQRSSAPSSRLGVRTSVQAPASRRG